MNEDPTIPIGVVTPPAHGQPVGVPAAAAAWGNFTLLARVGHGGFGEVYRAWDPHLQREVALKLLLPGAVAGEAEYEAMLREARALASVRHPNIVPVYGIDRHDGRVGFWTDFVRGKTLSVLVHEQGTFGAREAALIGLDVARALSAVHRAGLLHRDIKAENVMREEGGRILLMDFGLSSLEQRQTNIAGTPNYMAPELFEGGKATVAADIYAMGVLLYFLVAGDYPVHLSGLSMREALEALPRRRPLMDLRPDLPESLLRTVSTATELDPAKRYQSAGQLANALAESLGTHAPADVSAAVGARPARGKSAKWILAALLSVAVLLAGSLVWYGARQRSSQTAHDNTSNSTASDEFQKAQDQLLRSYKEANLADAVKGFKAVLEKDPNNALAEARLGQAYMAQHGYQDDPKLLDLARDATNRAMQKDPDLAAPHITMASLAALEGRTDAATQEVKKALDLDPRSADAHGAWGEVYEAQGRGKDAIDQYQQAVALAPEDWRWPMSLGVAEYKQGNFADAIAQWEKAARLAPDAAIAYYDLSLAHRQLGQLEEARTELERSLKLDPTSRKYAALGSLLLFEGKYDDAAQMELKAIALNPNSYQAYGDLAAAYQWSGTHHDQAMEASKKTIQLKEADRAKQPNNPEFLAGLAGDYATIGNADNGLVLVRQALALAPDDPVVNYEAGDALELLGRRDEAILHIAKALAGGFNAFEFEHNPELKALRGDPKFASTLSELKAKK